MKSHAQEILEKMKSDDYGELNFNFAFKLTNESERGAILIGGSIIEEHLERLINIILPSQTKSYKSRLFNYPGALSSFSGKIELCYAFRIFDQSIYNSLNALRKLRNDAAHSSDTFVLSKFKNLLENIYSFELNFPAVIKNLSYDNLMQWKLHIIKEGLVEMNLAHYDAKQLIEDSLQKPSSKEAFEEQLTKWELAHGLTFLCLKIEAISDEYFRLIKPDNTWTELID